MLFHVSITNFRKEPLPTFTVLHRVLTHPVLSVNAVVTPLGLLGTRAYGKPTPRSNRAGQSGEHKPVLTNVDIPKDGRNRDTRVPDSSHGQRPSRNLDCHVKRSPDQRAIKRVPPSHVTTPKVPRTQWELYQKILGLLTLNPPAPFSRLMSIHQRLPALQSVESYNLLLQLSIRHSFSRHTQFLIESMGLNKIEPNVNTEKLVVRHLVMTGNWKQAWQQTVTRYPLMADIPMPVILELLAPGTRNFLKPRTFQPQKLPDSRLESHLHPEFSEYRHESVEGGRTPLKIPLDTLILILRWFPQLSIEELARLPPRAISYAVRGLIRSGHHEEAVVLTDNHLKTLPPVISPRQIKFARELVHLHLSWGDVKLANYKKRRRLAEKLFSLHPSLHPDSQTVFLLMRYMKTSKRCGIEAYLFYKDYRKRWGTVVESPEVRRRIVAYAIKQRKLGIAKEISLEGPLEDPSPPEQAVQGALDPLWRVRAWRKMYPRRGRYTRFWKRVLFRMLGRRRVRMRELHRSRRK